MIICTCEGITDKEVKFAIRCGAGSIEELSSCLGTGKSCGDCTPSLQQMLKKTKQAAYSNPSSSSALPATK